MIHKICSHFFWMCLLCFIYSQTVPTLKYKFLNRSRNFKIWWNKKYPKPWKFIRKWKYQLFTKAPQTYFGFNFTSSICDFNTLKSASNWATLKNYSKVFGQYTQKSPAFIKSSILIDQVLLEKTMYCCFFSISSGSKTKTPKVGVRKFWNKLIRKGQ